MTGGWLCSTKTLLTETAGRQDLAHGLSFTLDIDNLKLHMQVELQNGPQNTE